MNNGWVMFGEIVGNVELFGSPENVDVAEVLLILYLMKVHCHMFGAALFDGIGCKAVGDFIVCLDGGG